MNRTIARALLLDAFSQVMDNKVFRMLVLTVITLIAPAFLIGFREDGIHVLFGWKFYPYEDVYRAVLHTSLPHTKNAHILLIQGMQTRIVQGLAGSVGILFCIAATAFFVPRMLEKGAADTLFTKPISRVVLLASRYVAGLIFVGALSFLLVLGIHVGLLVVSGYSDPAFLWSTLTLIYVYALVQTVSVAVGVFTRSSVAAILCTLVFFTFNGCIQGVWVLQQHSLERSASMRESDAPAEAVEKSAGFLDFVQIAIDSLHFALPKTHDADVLTQKLRTVVVGRSNTLTDAPTRLEIGESPDGFTLEGPGGAVDLLVAPARWRVPASAGDELGTISLSRRSRLRERPASGDRADQPARTSSQSISQAASEFMKSVQDKPGVVGAPLKDRERSMKLPYEVVHWTEDGSHGKRARHRAFFAVDDWMYELDVDTSVTNPETSELRDVVGDFMNEVRVARDDARYLDPGPWYESRFGWTSPLKFNAFFSIGSSLAFALVMLGAAVWRLSRMDL